MSASIDSGSVAARPGYDSAPVPALPDETTASGLGRTPPSGALGSVEGAPLPIGVERSNGASLPQPNPDLELPPPDPAVAEMGQAEAAMHLARIMEDFIMEFGKSLAGLNDGTASTMRDLAVKAAKEAKDAAIRMINYTSSLLRKLGKWASMFVGVIIAVVVAKLAVEATVLTDGLAAPLAVWACAAAATKVGELIATIDYDVKGKDGLPDAWEKGGGRVGMGLAKMDFAEVTTGFIELDGKQDEAWASWVAMAVGLVAMAMLAGGATKLLGDAAKASANAGTDLAEKITRYSSVIVKSQVATGLKGAAFTGVEAGEKYQAQQVQTAVDHQEAESVRLNGHADQASDRYKEGVDLGNQLVQQLTELMASVAELLKTQVDGYKATASTPQHA